MSSMSDLEKDIEARRARLDEKIDRIQDRLSPGNLVDEMLGSARQTPLNGVYDSALDAVRRNPVPVLLIAAGVGLLLRSMSGGGARKPIAGRPAPLPSERAPVLSTGADRAYDPGRPAGRPAHDVADDPKI